jgi:hypothetical protein
VAYSSITDRLGSQRHFWTQTALVWLRFANSKGKATNCTAETEQCESSRNNFAEKSLYPFASTIQWGVSYCMRISFLNCIIDKTNEISLVFPMHCEIIKPRYTVSRN